MHRKKEPSPEKKKDKEKGFRMTYFVRGLRRVDLRRCGWRCGGVCVCAQLWTCGYDYLLG